MVFKDWINLSEDEYNKPLINEFEQEAFTTFTYVEDIQYDIKSDEIVLVPSISVTNEREEIIAGQLQDVSEEMSRSFNIVAVSDEQIRVKMPSGFTL